MAPGCYSFRIFCLPAFKGKSSHKSIIQADGTFEHVLFVCWHCELELDRLPFAFKTNYMS
jgi:hypothetical protein